MKRFITRKKYNIYKIKLFIFFVIFLFSIFFSLKLLNKVNDDSLVNYLLNNSVSNNFNFVDLMNFNLSKPDSIIQNTISSVTGLSEVVPVVNNDSNKDPLIYIYNTHQSEEYLAGNLANYNISPSVYMASNILKKELEKYNIYSIVEDDNIKDLLNKNGWGYNNSYKASRIWLNNIREEYPSIKYFIDLHRDSVSQRVTIGDKGYAKIMFVLGMNYDTYEENEKIMLDLNEFLNDNYYGISRDILYAKKNTFNQDISSGVILIEVGGNESSLEEVYNSVVVLAEAISNTLGGY